MAGSMAVRRKGYVKSYNCRRGFGFIIPEFGGPELFVQQSSINPECRPWLIPGETVEFVVSVNHNGRPSAVSVIGFGDSHIPVCDKASYFNYNIPCYGFLGMQPISFLNPFQLKSEPPLPAKVETLVEVIWEPEGETEWRNWADLHGDVLLIIFNKITAADILLSAQLVCKPWRQMSLEPSVWKCIELRMDKRFENMVSLAMMAVDRSDGCVEELIMESFPTDDLMEYIAVRYMGKPKEGGISANWESSHTILFCDLCIREIELGNRPTTHFSKDGWKNLVTKFKDGSGLLYDRAQLKNKWDQLKREWKLWKDLKKGETGLGWDPIKKTIDASDLWWQERIKMIPLAKKFRYAGIAPELEERLDSMFRQVVATGRNVWFPAAGIMPPLFADEEVVLVDEDNSTELGDDIASPPEKVPLPKKLGKRKKVEKGRKNDILARMDDLVESSRSVSSRITTPIVPPSLLLLDEAVDEIEKNEEICADPDFYDFATVFLLTTVNRGMFLKLPAHKRVIWLKNRYNQSTGRVG